MKNFLETYGKAISAVIGALVAGLGSAMLDTDLTVGESIAALGAALVFGFAAWAAPYKPTL